MRPEGNSGQRPYHEESFAPYEEFLAAYHFTIITYAHEAVDPREAQDAAHESERVLSDTVRDALKLDIYPLVSSYFGDSVTVKIGPLQGGSIAGHIVLVLAAGESMYEFRSKYHDVADSLLLMQSQIRRILRATLRQTQIEFPVRHDVNVRLIQAPALRKDVSMAPVHPAPAQPSPSAGKPPEEWIEVAQMVRELLHRTNSQSQTVMGFLMVFTLMEFAVIVAILAWVLANTFWFAAP
jgi:hypothetical protein